MLDTICDVMKAAYDTRTGNASFKRKNEDFLYVTQVVFILMLKCLLN